MDTCAPCRSDENRRRIGTRMKNQALLYLFIVVMLAGAMANAFAGEEVRPSTQDVIALSDAVRNPDIPFRLNLHLTEYAKGSVRNEIILKVYSKIDRGSEQFKNLVRYIEPPRDLGKVVLMNGNRTSSRRSSMLVSL